MPKSHFVYIANMSFNAIRENKIIMKISEFTVLTAMQLSRNSFYFNSSPAGGSLSSAVTFANSLDPDQA